MVLFQQPGEEGFEALVAENLFISDIQNAIELALADRQISQSELARLLGVSSARVSQILGGNGANLTARTVARIASVLGLRAAVTFADTCLEGWWREDHDEDEVATGLADWVRVACETLEGEGIKPSSPSNDAWRGDSTGSAEVDGTDQSVAA